MARIAVVRYFENGGRHQGSSSLVLWWWFPFHTRSLFINKKIRKSNKIPLLRGSVIVAVMVRRPWWPSPVHTCSQFVSKVRRRTYQAGSSRHRLVSSPIVSCHSPQACRSMVVDDVDVNALRRCYVSC